MAAQTADNGDSPTTTRPRIPLTTIFTPPASCLDVVTYDGTRYWQGGYAQKGDAGCYPSGFYNIYNSWYTPGICPQSWTSVGKEPLITLGNDAFCCPSSYYLFTTTSGIRNVCASLISEDLTNVFSTSTLDAGSLPDNAHLTTYSKANIRSNTVFADVIQVRWNSQNPAILSLLAAATSTSRSSSSSSSGASPGGAAATAATTTSPPGPTASSSSTSSDSNNNSGGLSSGAEAGIGIGAAAIAVILALLALFFMRRRRRQKRDKPVLPTSGEEYKYHGLHEMEHPEKNQGPPVELDGGAGGGGGNIGELPATEKAPAELDPGDHNLSHAGSVSSVGRSPIEGHR